MVKVADVVAIGDSQQRIFPARIESGDSTDLSFKRGGQIESLDVRQEPVSLRGKRSPGSTPGKRSNASTNGRPQQPSLSGSSTASRRWPVARPFQSGNGYPAGQP
jgi:hypothetical protein